MKNLLLINTKAYLQGTGKKAEDLALVCKKLSKKANAEIILAVQPSDISKVSKHITAFSQHVDGVDPGSHTGHILAESVRAAGASGTLINHSERALVTEQIVRSLERARFNGMRTVICVPDPVVAKEFARLGPDFIAIEPPELIGSGISVSQSKPSVITDSVRNVRKANPKVSVLCGAGISAADDITKSLELGAVGVLVASGIVKAKNKEAALKDILKGFI